MSIEDAWKKMNWGNTTQTAQDWARILESGSPDERMHLFQHLFREDPDGRFLSVLLSVSEKTALALTLTKPMWRADLEKRRKLYRAVYLGEPQSLPELEWRQRDPQREI